MIRRPIVVALVTGCLVAGAVPAAPAAASALAAVTPEPGGVGGIEHAGEPIPGRYIVQLSQTPTTSTPRGDLAQARRLADAYSRARHRHHRRRPRVRRRDERGARRGTRRRARRRAVEEDGLVAREHDADADAVVGPRPHRPGRPAAAGRRPPLRLLLHLRQRRCRGHRVRDRHRHRADHVDFGGRAVEGADCTSGPCQPGTAVDCNGHGTHVSGTIGGTTYGVAKNVTIVAVRVLNCAAVGSTSGVIEGISWVTADHVAHPDVPVVANLSLGGARSAALNDAVAASIATGISYTIAAGNGTNDGGGAAIDAQAVSPASAPDAVTVGATDRNDYRVSFSNFGSCVDLFAPGVGITSDGIGDPTATDTRSGTSMAAPHVAGVIARFLQSNPTASPATVVAALTQAASHEVVGAGTGSPDLLLFADLVAPPGPVSGSCGGEYTPITPTRVLDTRGDPGISCPTSPPAKLSADQEQFVSVVACAGLPPSGVAAAVVNVTVDAPNAASYLTV